MTKSPSSLQALRAKRFLLQTGVCPIRHILSYEKSQNHKNSLWINKLSTGNLGKFCETQNICLSFHDGKVIHIIHKIPFSLWIKLLKNANKCLF